MTRPKRTSIEDIDASEFDEDREQQSFGTSCYNLWNNVFHRIRVSTSLSLATIQRHPYIPITTLLFFALLCIAGIGTTLNLAQSYEEDTKEVAYNYGIMGRQLLSDQMDTTLESLHALLHGVHEDAKLLDLPFRIGVADEPGSVPFLPDGMKNDAHHKEEEEEHDDAHSAMMEHHGEEHGEVEGDHEGEDLHDGHRLRRLAIEMVHEEGHDEDMHHGEEMDDHHEEEMEGQQGDDHHEEEMDDHHSDSHHFEEMAHHDEHGDAGHFIRNVTGICDDPELVESFQTTSAIVGNAAFLHGVVIRHVTLSPYGVACLSAPSFERSGYELGQDLFADPEHASTTVQVVSSAGALFSGPYRIKMDEHHESYLGAGSGGHDAHGDHGSGHNDHGDGHDSHGAHDAHSEHMDEESHTVDDHEESIHDEAHYDHVEHPSDNGHEDGTHAEIESEGHTEDAHEGGRRFLQVEDQHHEEHEETHSEVHEDNHEEHESHMDAHSGHTAETEDHSSHGSAHNDHSSHSEHSAHDDHSSHAEHGAMEDERKDHFNVWIMRIPIEMPSSFGYAYHNHWGIMEVSVDWDEFLRESGIDPFFEQNDDLQFVIARETGEHLAASHDADLVDPNHFTHIDLDYRDTSEKWTLNVGVVEGYRPSWYWFGIGMSVLLAFLISLMFLTILVTWQGHKDFLDGMLPKKALHKIRRGEVYAEHFDMVTIFFSDIVGYTNMTADMRPIDVMKMLNSFFTEVDKLADKHGVHKVETIGDAYMCVGGCPERCMSAEAAQRVAMFALDMIDLCENFRLENGSKLLVRCGLNSGRVVAGVVGTTLPHFSLFGDAVNTASRMESTSERMRIQCSDMTYRLLRDAPGYDFDLSQRGGIQVKGKGQMNTWWINGATKRSKSSGVEKSVSKEKLQQGSSNLETSQSADDSVVLTVRMTGDIESTPTSPRPSPPRNVTDAQ